jgi:hypothetical protein
MYRNVSAGSSMILILSRPDDPHVPYVTRLLKARGADTFLWDPASFPATTELEFGCGSGGLTRRHLRLGDRVVDLDRVSSVWVRRPGKPAAGKEVRDPEHRRWVAEESERALAGLWDTLECRWVPGRPRAHDAARSTPHQLLLAARLARWRAPSGVPALPVTRRPGGTICRPTRRNAAFG